MKRKTDNNSAKHIICFAGCDWWYHNRGLFCPQVMTRLAKKGHKVLFVNSLGMRIPSFKKDRHAFKKIMRKLKSLGRFIRKTDSGMHVLTPLSIPVYQSKIGSKLNSLSVFLQIKLVTFFLGFKNPAFYIGCPPALQIIKKFKYDYLMYERTDLFEEMPGTDKAFISALDDELSTTADLVLYVNTQMWKEGKKKNDGSLLLGHGVDYEFFATAHESDYVPEDIASISGPIIGYYGDISSKTLDMKLFEYVAEQLPEMSLVLVGPVSTELGELANFKNVYFLGQKSYDEIRHYGKVFDVAIMPWNQNKWIKYCNPVKTKEYLALGNPVVSIYYPELDPYMEVVYSANSHDEFISAIREAVAENDPDKAILRRKLVENETWDSKVDTIISHINSKKTNPA